MNTAYIQFHILFQTYSVITQSLSLLQTELGRAHGQPNSHCSPSSYKMGNVFALKNSFLKFCIRNFEPKNQKQQKKNNQPIIKHKRICSPRPEFANSIMNFFYISISIIIYALTICCTTDICCWSRCNLKYDNAD